MPTVSVPRMIPLFLTVTTPDVTLKLSVLNDAIPLLALVASSAATVIVLSTTEVSMPSPPEIVKVSPRFTAFAVPVSPATLTKLLSI